MSKLRLVLLAAFAACAVSAAASASASALEFYVNHVLLQGLLHIESRIHPGSGNSILKTEFLGVKITISCPALDNSGWIDNGIKNNLLTGLGLITVNFLKCTVPEPESEHCKVVKELIVATSLVELITDGDVYALFLPDPTGANFTSIPFEGCKQAGLNSSFPITGNAAGLAENGISSLNFKPGISPNNGLKFSGAAATLEAVDLVLMEGGGAIESL